MRGKAGDNRGSESKKNGKREKERNVSKESKKKTRKAEGSFSQRVRGRG